MHNKTEILNILNLDKQILRNLHLTRIGLFGSVARGTHNEKSDLDFLIEYEEGFRTFKTFNKIIDYLEGRFGENFDVVTKESITDYMYKQISKDIQYVRIVD